MSSKHTSFTSVTSTTNLTGKVMNDTVSVQEIEAVKVVHKREMDMYAENIQEHVAQYGPTPCDYLAHRQRMESYHRGAWNALNELLTTRWADRLMPL